MNPWREGKKEVKKCLTLRGLIFFFFLSKGSWIFRGPFFLSRTIFSFQLYRFLADDLGAVCGSDWLSLGTESKPHLPSWESGGNVQSCPVFGGSGAEPVENGIPANSQTCGITEWGGCPRETEPILQERKLREVERFA